MLRHVQELYRGISYSKHAPACLYKPIFQFQFSHCANIHYTDLCACIQKSVCWDSLHFNSNSRRAFIPSYAFIEIAVSFAVAFTARPFWARFSPVACHSAGITLKTSLEPSPCHLVLVSRCSHLEHFFLFPALSLVWLSFRRSQCRLYQWANWALAQGLPLWGGLLISDGKNFSHCTLHFYINIYYTSAFCLLRTVMRAYMDTCIKPVLKWVRYSLFCVLFITVQKILKTETN